MKQKSNYDSLILKEIKKFKEELSPCFDELPLKLLERNDIFAKVKLKNLNDRVKIDSRRYFPDTKEELKKQRKTSKKGKNKKISLGPKMEDLENLISNLRSLRFKMTS